MNYYLAIDIGASSGRHIAAWREQGEIKMKEVYRFDNFPETENGHLVWNLSRLCDEVINGLVACKETGITPTSVGIDTWAVDYVLLDAKNQPLHPMFCYRDRRGEEGAELVHKIIPFTDLYKKTGIQYQPFNTIYQMYWDKVHGRLDGAEDFLMLPEYLSFLLSGVKRHEYTNATSTGLLDARTRKWDIETIRELELPERLFRQEPVMPPIKLGQLTEEIAEKVGFSCDVILPATHDTASAVVAVPRVEVGGTSLAYISSGTWSLLGTELETPVTTIFAESANFTNEGGVGTIRFLKNIMGLWLVQCLKRELNDKYSFAELAEMARKEAHFDYHLDVNASRYLAPKSIMAEMIAECEEKGYPVPQTPGEFAYAIYQSLAYAYAEAIAELEKIIEKRITGLAIVGGGVNNTYLNELTENAIHRPVIAGAAEATALGNIILQEEAYV